VGVENFCTKLPKGTLLRQIWSNKSFGVCGSYVVLTLESDEKKKYARIAIGKSMSSITVRPLPRRRDTIDHHRVSTPYTIKMRHFIFDYVTPVFLGRFLYSDFYH